MSKRFQRKQDERRQHSFVHIFTNGQKTEIIYFNSKRSEIRKNDIKVRTKFINSDPLKLVEKVITNMNEHDEYWVVFDKDDFDKNFDSAIQKARNNGLQVAYSNEAFEIWFLLHFSFMKSAISRSDYYKKVTENYQNVTGDKKYRYDKVESLTQLITVIKNRESIAIKNAEKLLENHKNEASFIKKNPSTTVHLLVERLNKFK